jgi:FkbM family methyltransferase
MARKTDKSKNVGNQYEISIEDFELSHENLSSCLDLYGICRKKDFNMMTMKLLKVIAGFMPKFTSRIFLWLEFLRSFRGLSFKGQLNIFISALFDIFFYSISGWAYNPKMLFSGIYEIKPYRILIYERGGTEDLYNALPRREGDVHDFIVDNLKRGDVFVDVGANIGYYTILASRLVGTGGRVFAVEPVPQTVKVLKFNIKLNELRNVTVVDKVAWNSCCKLKMKIAFGEFGCASFFHNGVEVDVDAIPLDEVLVNVPKIKLIKIDVEGAEYEVLQGLRRTLTRTEYVVLELQGKGVR